jgi:signal transduction histidine kinase
MRHFKIFILLVLPFLCIAQQRKTIDSLLKILESGKEDTIQVHRLNMTAVNYTVIRPDSNIFYSTKALELSKKLNFKNGEAHASQILSSGYKIKGEYPLAWEYLQHAKTLYSELKNEERQLFMEFAEGTLTLTQGENREALAIFLKLKPRFESPGSIISKQHRIGLNNFLSTTYLNLNQLDSAIHYAQKGYNLNPDKKDFGSDWPLGIIADAYFLKNEIDSTFKYRRQEYLFSQYHNVPNSYAVLGLAKAFFKKGNIDSSLFYSKMAFSMARESGRNSNIIDASLFLAEIYEKLSPSESLYYYKLAYSLKDSVFGQEKIRQVQNLRYSAELREREVKEKEKENKAKLQRYLLTGGIAAFVLITLLLVRNNRHRRKANDRITKAYTELRDTQHQLVQSEKMASLGELTAGIAHEIQNPLNFVNNFSEVSTELLDEMREELAIGNMQQANEIADDVKQNLEKILHHGKQADAIVKGMLQHSRSSSAVKEPTDINKLADEYLRLAFHGLRAKDKDFNAVLKTDYDESIGNINIIPQDIGRVILNLITNAFYAVGEKKKQLGDGYEPVVSISTTRTNGKVEIKVADSGNGVPSNLLDKIFQPFFTTKPTGQGTGLGLSLSYDVIKAHGGEIKVETKEGEGAEFIIHLPV